jgi:hypothetical protein
VPTRAPLCVEPGSCATLAMPKSVTTALPSSSIRMLAGLISRWTTPERWAYVSADPTWQRMERTIGAGRRPASWITCSSERPLM